MNYLSDTFILYWLQPGLPVTVPTVEHRDVGDKYATGVTRIIKIRGIENISTVA